VEQAFVKMVDSAAEKERQWKQEQKIRQERELLERLLSALEANPDLAADIKIALRGSV
jgi:hypothetical protein